MRSSVPGFRQFAMTPTRPTNVRWLIVAMLVGLVFLAHFNRIAISVAGSERFIGHGLSEEQMGRVYSAFLLIYTIGMIPGGWLIDRFGPRWAMTLMGVGLGVCAAMTGVLGAAGLAIAALYVPLLVIRGVAGLSSVTLHPGAARAVSLWFPLSGRSAANGLVTAGALVGIAVTYPVFGRLMDKLDWPLAFVVSGATLAIFGLVWFLLAANQPANDEASNAANQLVVEDADNSSLSQEELDYADPTPAQSPGGLADFVRLFRNRSLVLLTLSYGAIGYVQYMFFYWVQYYFKTVLERSDDESREAAFIITISMAIGMAAGGWVSDWICRQLGQQWGCRLMALIGMGFSALFCLLGIATKDSTNIVLFFSLSLGAMGLCEGIFWTTAPVLEPRRAGLACALMNTGGNGVGMIAPVITPWIGKNYGWDTAVVVACCVAAVGGALWLGIRLGNGRS